MPAIERVDMSAARVRGTHLGLSAGGFVLVEQLGEGGLARVYLAVDRHTPARRVAVKVLRRSAAARASIVERFRLEARATAAIQHPRVVRALGEGRFETGERWLMLELLVGEDMRARVARRGPLPLPGALSLLAQACDGVHAAHRAGIVHCDLKPDHLFLQSPGDDVKLLDFGAAAVVGGLLAGAPPRAIEHVIGSPGFMAPEQACGYPATPRADVFSLGAIAYWALTGHLPFAGRTIDEYAHRVARERPVDPRVWRPDVPLAWVDVIARALAPDPARRPATPLELARGLLDVPGADDLVRLVAPAVLRGADDATTQRMRPITRRAITG